MSSLISDVTFKCTQHVLTNLKCPLIETHAVENPWYWNKLFWMYKLVAFLRCLIPGCHLQLFVHALCCYRVFSVAGPNLFPVCLHSSVIFWMHLCPWRVWVISVKQQRTTSMQVYKTGTIVALYVHINVHFLPAKVLVTQVFRTVS